MLRNGVVSIHELKLGLKHFIYYAGKKTKYIDIDKFINLMIRRISPAQK